MGPSWAPLGNSLGFLKLAHEFRSRASGRDRNSWRPFGCPWGPLGLIFALLVGSSWVRRGPSWVLLGTLWALLGWPRSFDHARAGVIETPGVVAGVLGGLLGSSLLLLLSSWVLLGPSGAPLGYSLGPLGLAQEFRSRTSGRDRNSWRLLICFCRALGLFFAPLVAVLGAFGELVGSSWVPFGPSWARPGVSIMRERA